MGVKDGEEEDKTKAEREAARLAGVEWAKNARYDHLLELVSLIEEAQGSSPSSRFASIKLNETMRQLEVKAGVRHPEAWQTGVLEFWKEVESQL